MPNFTIRNQVCPTPGCMTGRVVVHSRKTQRFRCTACKKTWVAHVQAFHYRLRVAPERVGFALRKLEEGYSIRFVAKLCKTSPSTVHRWKLRHLRSLRKSLTTKNYECV